MSKISFWGSVTDSDALGNRRWRIVSTLLFVVFSLALLARYGYVWKWVESLSLFVPDPVFFRSFLNNPGGMLAYAGAFLTQFLYYPFWGSCLLVLLLLGTQQLTCRLFRLEGVSYLYSFIPSFLLLTAVLDLGYTWATLKAPGHFFMPTLGVIFSLSCLALFRWVKVYYARLVLLPVIVALYPFCGFYALFATGLCLIDECVNRPGKKSWAVALVGVVSIVLFPKLYYYGWGATEQELSRLYVAGLPPFYIRKAEFMLWLPFLLLLAYYLLLSLGASTAGVADRSSRWRASGSWGLFVAGMLFTLWQAYGNPNFEAGVRSSLAIEAGDWQEAAKEAGRVRVGATRDVVINGRMADSYLGRPVSQDPVPMIPATYKDSRQGLLTFMQLCGLNMNYYSGQTNICYRWAVELSVEYGFRISYLKLLVKCALLNGEYALAKKYNDQIGQTLFHKDWAERYGRMIDQPELISQDPEFARIPKDPLPNRFVE